ncbi:MAG: SdpI family protein [Actinomycetota bacterium]|nr:SdpI family protein [Actinomycetota bacterium]
MVVPAVFEVLVGLVVVVLSVLMWQGRLRRNWAAGVRTPSTMRSDAAFKTANKVAAPLTGAGGVVFAICGVISALVPQHTRGAIVLAGALALGVLTMLGAAVGIRAARSVP